MQSVKIFYTGTKAKPGNLCFDTGRLGIFVTSCGNCHAKLIMSLEEAKQFANKYTESQKKRRTKSLLKQIEKIT